MQASGIKREILFSTKAYKLRPAPKILLKILEFFFRSERISCWGGGAKEERN